MTAKRCNVCLTDKAPEDFHRRAASADGLSYTCKVCAKARSGLAFTLNRDEANAARKERYLANHAHELEMRKKWRTENSEYAKQIVREWGKANPERKAEIDRAWRVANAARLSVTKKQYREANKGRYAAYFAAYKLARRQRVPPWADLGAIRRVYETAAAVQELVGVPVHVDHEIPLHGKTVSGLHVHTNLRIVAAEINLAKSNLFSGEV